METIIVLVCCGFIVLLSATGIGLGVYLFQHQKTQRQQLKKQIEEKTQAKEKIPAVKTLEIGGVVFPAASNIDEFFDVVKTHRACAILINTNEYEPLIMKARAYFSSKFNDKSFEFAVLSGRLICAGCKQDIPDSYITTLIFGKAAGQCPRCGNGKSYYAYDNPTQDNITQSDVDAIREYRRHLAQQWWKTTAKTDAICDHCNSPIYQGAGYLLGSSDSPYLYCERCADDVFGKDALTDLRGNQNYFGKGMLRIARQFVANPENKMNIYKAVLVGNNTLIKERLSAIKKLGDMKDRDASMLLLECVKGDENVMKNISFGSQAPIQEAALAELIQILQTDASCLSDAELRKISELPVPLTINVYDVLTNTTKCLYSIDTSLLQRLAVQELGRQHEK